MPVSGSSADLPNSSQMLQLESAVLSKTRGQAYYTKLQNWLEEQQTECAIPQTCSVEMMKKIITVLQKELGCIHFAQARVLISAIQHVARFQEFSPGLPVLLSSGLIEILVYAFQVTQTHISKSDQNPDEENDADILMETMLETVNDIADFNAEGKQLTVLKFADKLMDVVVDDRKIFRIRMEAQRSLNLLLENCPGNFTQTLTEMDVVKNLMTKMAEKLPYYGDFEMQVACTEALARLVVKSKRAEFAAEWFAYNKSILAAFLNVRDLNFETDCRKFLNFVNNSLGNKRSVHSFPCKEAYLGSYKLLQLPDENLPEFWVDFNSSSQSITMYVAEEAEENGDDSGMWETVTIKSNIVKKYHLMKQEQEGHQKLYLDLDVAGRDILHFCPSSKKIAVITFDANIDLMAALSASLGDEKRRLGLPTMGQKKASVSKVNVMLNRAEFNKVGPLMNGHAGSVNGDVHTAGASIQQTKPMLPIQHGTPNRPKVSVPVFPMRTPTLYTVTGSPASSVASSRVSSSRQQSGFSSAGSKKIDSTHHKTPTKSHHQSIKKVKTPLQIVVGDKQRPLSTTDTDSDAMVLSKSATRKVSMASTMATISMQRKRDSGIGTPAAVTVKESCDNNNKDTGSLKKTSTVAAIPSKEKDKTFANKSSNPPAVLAKEKPQLQKKTTVEVHRHEEVPGSDEDDSQVSKRNKKGKAVRENKMQQEKKVIESKNIKLPLQESQTNIANLNEEIPQIHDNDEDECQATKGKKKGKTGKASKAQQNTEEVETKKKDSSIRPTPRQTPLNKFKLYSNNQTLLMIPDEKEEEDKNNGDSRPKSRRKAKRGRSSQEKDACGPEDTTAKSIINDKDDDNDKPKTRRGRMRKGLSHGEDASGTGDTAESAKNVTTQKEDKDDDSSQKSRRGRRRGRSSQKEDAPVLEDTAEDKTTVADQKGQCKETDTSEKMTRSSRGKRTTPDSSQELDLVIPSSIPGTQEGFNADIIPSSLPLERNSPKRRMNSSLSMSVSMLCSPSLSTITEESTQSRKTNSTGRTPDLRQRIHTDALQNSPESHISPNLLPKKDDHNTSGTHLKLKHNLHRELESEVSPKCNSDPTESDSQKNGRNKRYKPASPEYDSIVPVIPESQLSQESQTKEVAGNVNKKQERSSAKTTSATKRSMQSKPIKSVTEPSSNEENDPYKFTDTESVYSNVGKKGKGKKQTAPKKNNKQAGQKGSQPSTQAFSPELSPYQSQNDFRSPVPLSGVKTSKKTSSKDKNNKNDSKNAKKSKTAAKGKKIKTDDAGQDASLSDVEVMRDASAPKSSIREKYPLCPSDEEDLRIDEDVYEFSDDFTTKLNKKKAELEKFLGTERNSTSSAKPEKSLKQGKSANKSTKESIGKEGNKKKSESVGRRSRVNSKDMQEHSDVSKSVAFDSELRKFPTRTGPIPTPDMLDDEKKKMKKKKPLTPSESKVPFNWDIDDDNEEEEKEDAVCKKVPEKKNSKRKSKESKTADVVEEEQVGTEGFEVVDHEDAGSSGEDIKNRDEAKLHNLSKSKQSKDNKSRKNEQIELSDSGMDDIPGHEEISDEDDWGQQTSNSRPPKSHQNDTKQNKYGRKENKDDLKGKYDKDDIDKEINSYIDSQVKSLISETGKHSKSGKVVEEIVESDLGNLQQDQGRQTKTIDSKRSSKTKPVKTQKRKDMVHKEEKHTDSDDSVDVENEKTKVGMGQNRKNKSRKSQNKVASSKKDSDISDMDDDQLIQDKLEHYSRMILKEANKQDKEYQESEPDSDDNDIQQKGKGKSRDYQNRKKPHRRQSAREDSDMSDYEDEIEAERDEPQHSSRRNSKGSTKRAKSIHGRKNETKISQRNRYTKDDSDMSDDEDEEALHDKPQHSSRRNSKESTIRDKSIHGKKNETKKPQRNRYTKDDSDMSDDEGEEPLQDKPQQSKRKSLADIDREIKTSKTGKPKEKSTTAKKPVKSKQPQEKPVSDIKQKKIQSRMYGSQIEEAESDEAGNANVDDGNDFDTETVVSVESFHNLCKKLLQNSGDGVAATRSRRRVAQVNYQEPESSEIESNLSGSSASSVVPSNLVKSGPKTNQVQTITVRSPSSEEASPYIEAKRPKFDDNQSVSSNRSWLVEKPKQKVTTYSKTRAQQWIGVGPTVNLDTLSAKKYSTTSRAGVAKQKAPPALQKKPKRPRVPSDDEEEDNTYIYYFRQEETATKEVVMKDKQQPGSAKNRKKTINKGRKKTKTQRDEDADNEHFDALEVMRSQPARPDTTPISTALLDYNTVGDEIELYPLTPVLTQHDMDDIPMSQNSIAFTPRNYDTPTSSRTPKLVTFEDDADEVLDEEQEEDPVNVEYESLASGPALGQRPTKSALKRKYADVPFASEDEDEEDYSDEEEEEQVVERVEKRRSTSGQLLLREDVMNISQDPGGMLKPKNLFKTSFSAALQSMQKGRKSFALDDEDDNVAAAETASSEGVASSWESYPSETAPMAQMTQMLKVVGENLKDKMRTKQNTAQKLTESTIKTAQKQVSRLWSGQYKARRNAQEDFKTQLMTEIMGLESDLSEMDNSMQKSQSLLQQHQRKVAVTLANHVKKLDQLNNDYTKEGEDLEVQLGNHLVRNVQGLLRQGMGDMQKRMVQNAQHHEMQCMKRSLQSILQ